MGRLIARRVPRHAAREPRDADRPAPPNDWPDALTEDVTPARWRIWLSRLISLVLIPVGIYYLNWRAGTLAGTGVAGRALFAAEVFGFLFIAFSAVVFWRVRRRTGPSAPPFGSLDVFITVAGEPAEMVEHTLRAAIAISYPHRTYLLNDGRMTGADDWWEIEELARRYGVRCFARTSGDRSKAGNLNHALARTDGDFVAVIDADHEARPAFAHEALGYFVDRDVGWVATPQQFATDRSDILGNKESLFYSFVQCAKDASNASFSCGNAVVYRRSALNSIGGFSTWNIVEDLHSSYCMHSKGWKSVYHPRPLTIGLAPKTGPELVKQRLRWATDSLRMFLWDSPIKKPGLTLMQRLHYLHTGSFYLVAAAHLVFLTMPILHVLLGASVMRPGSIAEYAAHITPFILLAVGLIVAQGGFVQGLRGMQKVLYLSPTFIFAIVGALRGRKVASPVTAKVGQRGFSLLLFPQYVLFALLTATIAYALLRPDSGRAVSALWAAWMVAAVAIPVATVGAEWLGRLLRAVTRGAPAMVALLVAVVALGGPAIATFNERAPVVLFAQALGVDIEDEARHDPIGFNGGDGGPVESLPPRATLATPEQGAYMGAFNDSLLRSSEGVEKWSEEHGAQTHIAHWYQQWLSGETRPRSDWWEMIAAQDAVPMISWEPWLKPVGSVHSRHQPRVRLRRIAAGNFDDYIRRWARAAAAYRRPLLIRPMHEMNGDWYPWSVWTNNNNPRAFVRAWRHIHGIFEEEGATNVGWVWAVNAITGLERGRDIDSVYPGGRFVDWVSFTAFNWGDSSPWSRWRKIDEIISETYDALLEFDKPIMISELGTVLTGGDASEWVPHTMEQLENRFRRIKAVIWFDADYPGDINFELRGPSARAFERSVADRAYWSPDLVFNEI